MNHHYTHPPVGHVYMHPQGTPGPRPQPYFVPAAPQYGALLPPAGLHGHHPHYPHPHPMMMIMPPSPSYVVTSPMPPPANFQVDARGWYTPQHPPPSPPLHPPGLGVPLSMKRDDSEEPTTTLVSDIHEFWRGRLAPLPGYRSRPLLLPMRKSMPLEVVVGDQTPAKKPCDGTPIELLPPHSFFGPKYERSPGALTTPLREEIPLDPSEKKKEKIDDAKNAQITKNNRKEEKTQKEFQFDKYAESFIPQYLYAIQKEIIPLKPLPSIPVFPSLHYLHSFLIPRLIEDPNSSDGISPLLHAGPVAKDAKLPPLDAPSYLEHWSAILRWELDAIATEKEQIVLWKLGATVAVWQDAEFIFSVPGIRENHPYLEVGDLVHMREVLPLAKRNRKVALEGRVVALRKRQGLIHVRSEPLKEHIQTYVPLTLETIKTENGYVVFDVDERIPFEFNVSFMTNARPLCMMQRAVASVAETLLSPTKGTNLARQWIFPEVDDFTNAPSAMLPNSEIKEKDWVDSGLNAEQRLAVTSVSLYQGPVPRLISGPPGTGKTRTVVEAVLQIFRVQPEACILLCAPSNPATDTLVFRLHDHLSPSQMLRLNDPNRTFAEVSDTITPYCYVEDNKFGLPPWQKLMQYRVVVASCLDSSILVNAHCTNSQLMQMEGEVTRGLHPHRKTKHVVQPHWTHLLIDEAAQGSEPELLIPISVILPPVYGDGAKGRTFMPQLALCGDINQLGPIVVSNEARSAELEVSLLERLFERSLYSSHRKNITSALKVSSKRLPPYTTLVKNYRSHPVILMPPSAIFYNDTLEPFALANGQISWTGLAKPEFPLKFIGTDAVEGSNDERASWFNWGEIHLVIDVIKSLLENSNASHPPLKPGEISVMAPWRQQVWTLRKRLRIEGFSAVDVGTVEDYQGRESRVVIISCVRSSPRFLEEDNKKGMGLIFERKRMNVAITRAKELLIVIGNGGLLQRDPYWKSFLQFTLRNGLYEGPELSLEMDGNYISRLESKLIHSGKDLSSSDPEQAGLLLAGGVAREVLRE